MPIWPLDWIKQQPALRYPTNIDEETKKSAKYTSQTDSGKKEERSCDTSLQTIARASTVPTSGLQNSSHRLQDITRWWSSLSQRDVGSILTPSRRIAITCLSEQKSKSVAFGNSAFSIYGPKILNNLLQDIRTCNSVELLRKDLKTHLFKLSFKWSIDDFSTKSISVNNDCRMLLWVITGFSLNV